MDGHMGAKCYGSTHVALSYHSAQFFASLYSSSRLQGLPTVTPEGLIEKIGKHLFFLDASEMACRVSGSRFLCVIRQPLNVDRLGRNQSLVLEDTRSNASLIVL